jgi:hypothetical protein
MADLGDHEADPGDHDRPIWVITMLRSARSRCSGARNERELAVRGGRAAAGQPSPAELVSANVRRLDRLERYGLAARLSGGQWRVRTDLVSQLEARERTHPRHRIQVDQLGPQRQVDRSVPDRGPGRGRGRGLSR